VQAIDRTVEILHTVGAAPSGLTLSELTDRLRLPKTTVYRILQALLGQDFLRKDAKTKSYRLGPALLGLSANSLNQWDLRSIALPHLRQLAQITNETVCLTVLHRDKALCLETIESQRSTPFWVRIGKEMEFHCAAAGKVILAYLPDEQVERILQEHPLAPYTSRTITDGDELKAHLKEVRQRGYALCDGEIEVGVRALAAPIRQQNGLVTGSVTIIAPAERVDEEARRTLLPCLFDATWRISTDLGFRSTQPRPSIVQAKSDVVAF